MIMEEVKNELAVYINVLAENLNDTVDANDRPMYLKHLAETAIMFSVIRQGNNTASLREIIA